MMCVKVVYSSLSTPLLSFSLYTLASYPGLTQFLNIAIGEACMGARLIHAANINVEKLDGAVK